MNYKIPNYLLKIILNIIRIQNEQLLKIISKNENIDYELLKNLIISPYELNKILENS